MAGDRDNKTFDDDGRPAAAERPAKAPAPDEPTGRYKPGVEIARGGLGRVQRAYDASLDRDIALKTILRPSPTARARFDREMRITARLQHPNIVPVHDGGSFPDGAAFMAMRLVNGRSLAEAIAGCPTLPERMRLLPHVIDACNAIAYAHDQRIVHRDLKPDNILVGDFGETVVIDWGLAKELDADATAEETAGGRSGRSGSRSASGGSLTRVGAVMGTPSYMPPEQAAGQPIDERADVYALGAVLYHTLAGVRPYDGSADTVKAVSLGPPRPLVELVPDVPRDLLAVTEKSMARDPARRYADARSLAAELARFQSGAFVSAHHYGPAERFARAVRRNPVGAALAALIVLGTLGGVGLQARSSAQATARADAVTLDQARSVLGVDPGRTLALLDSLSPSRAFDADVRSLAAAAYAESPPIHLAWAGDGAPTHGVAWTHAGLLACATGSAVVFGPDLRPTRTVALPWEPSSCEAPGDGSFVVRGRNDVIVADADGNSELVPQGSPVFALVAGRGVRYAFGTAAGDVVIGTATGRHVVAMGEPVSDLAVGSDGTVVALTGSRVRAISPRDGATLGELALGEMPYRCFASPTTPEAVAVGNSGVVQRIRWLDGLRVDALPTTGSWWEHAAYVAPDVVVLGGGGNDIVELHLDTGAFRTLAVLSATPRKFELGPGGQIAIATDSGALALVSWPSGDVLELSSAGDLVYDLDWHPDGTHLAVARRTGVEVHSPSGRDGATVLAEPGGPFGGLAAGPDGRVLAVSLARSWVLGGGEPAVLEGTARGQPAWCGSRWWVPTASGVATFGKDGLADVTHDLGAAARAITCVPGGDHAFVTLRDGAAVAVRLADGATRVLVAPAPDAPIYTIAVSEQQRVLIGGVRVLELVDPSAPAVDITPPGLGAPGTDVVWWRGEPAIIGSDGVLRVGRGAEARVLMPSIATPTAVVVTRDGDLLVTDVDGALWVWRSPEHPGISRFVNRQYVHAVAVHPSGRWAATGGWDDLVVLWDLSDERVPGRVLRGHRDVVATLAWSGDGRVLYAGDRAGDVRAWSDPLAVEPDALRRQVRALAEALAGARPLPSPEALAAAGAR